MLVAKDSFELVSPRGFLVLEGVNGAGKTTLQERLARRAEARQLVARCTREPGATALGAQLRSILLDSEEKVSPLAEMFLFAANRAEHVEKLIRPALARNEIVLCDRFLYSSLAFQGYGRGIDLEMLSEVNRRAVDGLYPDFVLLLDLPPGDGLARSGGRAGGQRDSFEEEDAPFHERIRQGFLRLAEERPEPFVVLDASRSADEVFEAALPYFDRWLDALCR